MGERFPCPKLDLLYCKQRISVGVAPAEGAERKSQLAAARNPSDSEGKDRGLGGQAGNPNGGGEERGIAVVDGDWIGPQPGSKREVAQKTLNDDQTKLGNPGVSEAEDGRDEIPRRGRRRQRARVGDCGWVIW